MHYNQFYGLLRDISHINKRIKLATSTMKIYDVEFSRCIWLSIKQEEIRMDLRNLGPDFEYERCATVTDISGFYKAMNMNLNDLRDYIYVLVTNKSNAFALLTGFPNEYKIDSEYFSG